jgi:hypothetical protein
MGTSFNYSIFPQMRAEILKGHFGDVVSQRSLLCASLLLFLPRSFYRPGDSRGIYTEVTGDFSRTKNPKGTLLFC